MPHVSSEEALKKIREEEIEEAAQRKAKAYGLPYIDLLSQPLELESLRAIREGDARAGSCVVFMHQKKSFRVALLDPNNEVAKRTIQGLQKFGNVEVFVTSPRGLEKFLDAYHALPPEREEITAEVALLPDLVQQIKEGVGPLEALARYLTSGGEQETSEIFSRILATAIALDASDIHVEPGKTTAALRFRLDGMLVPVVDIETKLYERLRERVKLVSGLKLNIQETPQDGRFSIVLSGEEPIEVRTSSIPDPQGEDLVLRLLNPKIIQVKLGELGLREDDLAIIEAELKKPNGLIIITGPTGSGKTTTLYAFLRTINVPGVKIITIEDPIEYQLPGIEQTQVDNKGYTFASGLAAILRQDPDVILVGEIRDLETAQTTMHASLTGHLVFSTLHTNDVIGTIPRLIDLGVKPNIIAPAINLAVAQRLLRRLCTNCAQEGALDETTLKKISTHLRDLPPHVGKIPQLTRGTKIKHANPTGCPACNGRGYKGRIGVFELFRVGPEMAELIQRSPTEEAIFDLAKKLGLVTMMQDALMKVVAGVTDLREVERVVGPV